MTCRADIYTWLSDNADAVDALLFGTLVFEIQDGRLVMANTTVKDRVRFKVPEIPPIRPDPATMGRIS